MKYTGIYALFLVFIFCNYCEGQNKTDLPTGNAKSQTEGTTTLHGPGTSVRTIRQDRKGNIWLASNEGIIRYNGKSFTNITGKVSSDRFFSVLEDKKGNFWFGTYGSGIYYYDARLNEGRGNPFKILQPGTGLLIMGFFLFMKIKVAIFGLVPMEEQAVTMANHFEIL